MTLTYGSLFSGIGGLDLGVEAAGFEPRWQVEWDGWCQRLLARRFPEVAQYSDVTQVDPASLETVDLIVGGFPCQPISVAGRQQAQDDERWLWPDYLRLVQALKPSYVLVENVRNLLRVNAGTAMGEVLAGLAQAGYDAAWDVLGAVDVGAPHRRDRLFIRAWRRTGTPLADHPVAVLGADGRWAAPGATLWAASVPYADPWPTSGAMVAGTCWQRPQQLHGVSGNVGGAWPTPVATDARGATDPDVAAGERERGAMGLSSAVALRQSSAGQWPTPRSHDGTAQGATPARPGHGGEDLASAARRRWPTPGADRVGQRTDTRLSGDGRELPNKLGWAVGDAEDPEPASAGGTLRMWPTPDASPSASTAAENERITLVRKNGGRVQRRLVDAAAGLAATEAPATPEGGPGSDPSPAPNGPAHASMWPTPDAGGRNRSTPATAQERVAGGHHLTLHDAVYVRTWPTPMGTPSEQRTYARTPSQAAGRRGKYLQAEANEVAADEAQQRTWPTPRASEWKGTGPIGSKSHQYRLDRSYLDATVQDAEHTSGPLNPTWVEWLMGLPLGWTDPDVDDPQAHPGWATDPAEDGSVPRLQRGTKQVRDRLKAIGNAVVPQVAYVAALDLLRRGGA